MHSGETRSIAKPTPRRPMILAPPRTDKASAALAASTPCWVRMEARLVTRPFSLKAERIVIKARIQNAAVRNAVATVTPVSARCAVRTMAASGRLRTRKAVRGKPRIAMPPNNRKALRQPWCWIIHSVTGGIRMEPTPLPVRSKASANPR